MSAKNVSLPTIVVSRKFSKNLKFPSNFQFHADGYVLKVTNEVDSRDPEFLSAQNCAMSHLASKRFSCPRPVPNLEGELLSVVKLGAFLRYCH